MQSYKPPTSALVPSATQCSMVSDPLPSPSLPLQAAGDRAGVTNEAASSSAEATFCL